MVAYGSDLSELYAAFQRNSQKICSAEQMVQATVNNPLPSVRIQLGSLFDSNQIRLFFRLGKFAESIRTEPKTFQWKVAVLSIRQNSIDFIDRICFQTLNFKVTL